MFDYCHIIVVILWFCHCFCHIFVDILHFCRIFVVLISVYYSIFVIYMPQSQWYITPFQHLTSLLFFFGRSGRHPLSFPSLLSIIRGFFVIMLSLFYCFIFCFYYSFLMYSRWIIQIAIETVKRTIMDGEVRFGRSQGWYLATLGIIKHG